MKDTEHITQYFPDYRNDQLPEKKYFWDVLSTIFPREVAEIVAEARGKRASQNDPDADELIKIDPGLKNDIMDVLNHRSKNLSFHLTLL
jgi:hypothetical protein